MYYAPGLTWRSSWLEKIDAGEESNFADLYKVEGLRGTYFSKSNFHGSSILLFSGVFIASQVTDNVTEHQIEPSNILTLITFDGGAEWSRVTGPSNDTTGHPIPGCQVMSCYGEL